jgi:hypothetical protein
MERHTDSATEDCLLQQNHSFRIAALQQSIRLRLPHKAFDALELGHQRRRTIGRGHASAGRDLNQFALDLAKSPPLHFIVVAHQCPLVKIAIHHPA